MNRPFYRSLIGRFFYNVGSTGLPHLLFIEKGGRDMEIQLLKTFILAAEKENFREVAEGLMMTQPAVTKQIQKLEKELNFRLFDRVQKRVVLNANGHYFLPRAMQLVALEEQISQEMQAFLAGYSQKITIGVAPQIANSTLPFVIQHFKQFQPDVNIQIDILPSNEIAEAVFRQEVDIGLSKVPSTRELLTTMIANEPVMIVSAQPFEVKDFHRLLNKFPIYTHSFSPYWEQIEKYLPRNCQIERLNQTEVIKTFIKQGMGIAFLPKSVVQTEVEKGELFTQLPQIDEAILSATFVYTKYIHPVFDQFIDACMSIYEK